MCFIGEEGRGSRESRMNELVAFADLLDEAPWGNLGGSGWGLNSFVVSHSMS